MKTEIYYYEGEIGPGNSLKIETDSGNFGNNSDTFHVTIETEQEMIVDGKNTNKLEFDIVGNWELTDLLGMFKKANDEYKKEAVK